MKIKINKVIITLIYILMINVSICFAKTNSYVVTDSYYFTLPDNVYSGSYVRIFLGNINIAKYSQGRVSITPIPDTYDKDIYGNVTAVYYVSDKKGKTFDVSVTKNITTTEYEKIINDGDAGTVSLTAYLRPALKIESDNSYIVSKANELTKDCEDDYEKVKNIFEYVNTYMDYDTATEYRNKGALSAILTGKGVCEEYVSLFVALCRASGIPARIITGYNAEGLEIDKPIDSSTVYHAWAEVNFEEYGWIPVELTAEYYYNGVKEPYWDGFMQLPEPVYVVEGLYNPESNEITWRGVEFEKYDKTIKRISSVYFSDIGSYWGKKYVENLYDKKVVNGYEDGTFMPENEVTRIEFMAMLSRTLNYLKMSYYSIDDIYYPTDFVDNWSKNDYDMLMKYYSYYAKDYMNGAGYSTMNYIFGDNLEMNKAITREEVVALIAPFLKDTKEYDESLVDIYDAKFVEEIKKAYVNEIITGYEDSTFKPEQTITRGEIATILDRTSDKGLK